VRCLVHNYYIKPKHFDKNKVRFAKELEVKSFGIILKLNCFCFS